jgi:peptidase M28-like protein
MTKRRDTQHAARDPLNRVPLSAVRFPERSRDVQKSAKANHKGHEGITKGLTVTALGAVLLLGCAGDKSQKTETQGTTPNTASAAETTIPPAKGPLGPEMHVNADKAWQYAKEIVALGTRPLNSPAHKKVEDYIVNHLKGGGVEVVDDAFTADTPVGKLPVRNLIAKFPGKKDGIIVIASHYDTNFGFPKDYVGANDGATSSALLLAMADTLNSTPRDGYSVWLLWTDGEEAIKQWSDSDSLYGTRHVADKWQQDGSLKKMKAFILLDMIGDKDLNVDRDQNSTPWLEDLVAQAAHSRGYQDFFFARDIGVEDDHLPFKKKGVPVADLIDFDYGYGNVFWHTPQDTLDKCSAESLKIVGDTTLETVRQLDAR